MRGRRLSRTKKQPVRERQRLPTQPVPPSSSEEALQQAQAEELTLLKAKNTTGFYGVHLKNPGTPKPYQVQLKRGGKRVSLGNFATAEEAALCVARTPEGKAAAAKVAAKAAVRYRRISTRGGTSRTRMCMHSAGRIRRG